VTHGGGCPAGDLPLRLVLVVGLDELGVLLPDLPGVWSRRAEQQRLEAAERVLPDLPGRLPLGNPACRSPTNVAAA
jgi:hypothetical protein